MEGRSKVAQTTGEEGVVFITGAHHEEVVARWREIVTAQAKLLRELKDDNEKLLARYHELRVSGANPAEKIPDAPKSPLAAIGPKTSAALKEMSIGLPNSTRRAMESVVLSLAAEGWADDKLAAHVRAGEAPRANGNGRR